MFLSDCDSLLSRDLLLLDFLSNFNDLFRLCHRIKALAFPGKVIDHIADGIVSFNGNHCYLILIQGFYSILCCSVTLDGLGKTGTEIVLIVFCNQGISRRYGYSRHLGVSQIFAGSQRTGVSVSSQYYSRLLLKYILNRALRSINAALSILINQLDLLPKDLAVKFVGDLDASDFRFTVTAVFTRRRFQNADLDSISPGSFVSEKCIFEIVIGGAPAQACNHADSDQDHHK